jgi:signal transduction histidine kinase
MRFFTTVHILLLAYIITALIFWGTSLYRKSQEIYTQDIRVLKTEIDSVMYPEMYNSRVEEYKTKLTTSKKQYIGEGSTFLLIILIGAAVVYTSFRRSVMLSRQQNNFMLSVTHELKSPIAAMKLNLQTLERYHLDEEKKTKLLERCVAESNRLNDLCNNMLIASQMEGRQYVAAKEKLQLDELVSHTINDYSSRYSNRIINDGVLECSITGDRLLLQLAINNLLENAIKYTPADKHIKVSLRKNTERVIVKVADEGIGISDSEKGKVFHKFYRIGNEETRKTKGTGLGLYLTNKIVKQHNGKIVLTDNKPTGCVFEIYLPSA